MPLSFGSEYEQLDVVCAAAPAKVKSSSLSSSSAAASAAADSDGSGRQVRRRTAALRHSLIGPTRILVDDENDDDDDDDDDDAVAAGLPAGRARPGVRQARSTTQPGNNATSTSRLTDVSPDLVIVVLLLLELSVSLST